MVPSARGVSARTALVSVSTGKCTVILVGACGVATVGSPVTNPPSSSQESWPWLEITSPSCAVAATVAVKLSVTALAAPGARCASAGVLVEFQVMVPAAAAPPWFTTGVARSASSTSLTTTLSA